MRNWKIRGQAIVEIVVAAGIVMVALTVLVAAVSKAVLNNRLSKERVIGTRLAQEVVEQFSNLRNSINWNTFCDEINTSVNYCASPTFLAAIDSTTYANIFATGNRLSQPCPAANGTITRSKTNYSVYINFTSKSCNAEYSTHYKVTVSWFSAGKDQMVELVSVLGNI